MHDKAIFNSVYASSSMGSHTVALQLALPVPQHPPDWLLWGPYLSFFGSRAGTTEDEAGSSCAFSAKAAYAHSRVSQISRTLPRSHAYQTCVGCLQSCTEAALGHCKDNSVVTDWSHSAQLMPTWTHAICRQLRAALSAAATEEDIHWYASLQVMMRHIAAAMLSLVCTARVAEGRRRKLQRQARPGEGRQSPVQLHQAPLKICTASQGLIH